MRGTTGTKKTAIVGGLCMTLAFGSIYGLSELRGTEAQEDCTQVFSIGPETESLITEPFDIEGNSFRVSGNLTDADDNGIVQLIVTPLDQENNELAVDFLLIGEEGPYDENVLEGPGTFTLEIEASPDAEYTLKVEDCGATPGGVPEDTKDSSTTPKTKTPVTPPKTPATLPKSSSSVPKTPSSPPADGTLMNAGGPASGPVPLMPDGSCPQEFPDKQPEGCYSV